MNKDASSSRGFTIVELMIATTVFAVLLLIASGAIIGINRLFYKGLTQARTQEVARNISEEIASNLQFSASNPQYIPPAPGGSVQGWCIANRRYMYQLGQQVDDTSGAGALIRGGSCADTLPTALGTALAGEAELVGEHMRLANLVIDDSAGNGIFSVRVKVVFGDNEVLDNPTQPNATCAPGSGGSHFCGIAEYEIVVERRL